MSSSNSPCAACKLLRRKCTQDCVFAPHFPPDQPQKFANVHKVFGASNVAKLLNELHSTQRAEAVTSLVYEAEARLRDPIYGCVGLISVLQNRLKLIHQDLFIAKKELSNYIGPSAMLPMLQLQLQHPGFIQPHANNPTAPAVFPYNMQAPMPGLPAGQPPGAAQFVIHDQHHRQMLEAQQLVAVAAAREQEMFRSYEQQAQQTNQLVRLAAARKQQEMFRCYEQQRAQQTDQLVRLAAAIKQQEMVRSYEQQQAQQTDQLMRMATAREQEMFRSYEQQAQQSDQLMRLAAAREQQEMAQQSEHLVGLAAGREQPEMFGSYEQQAPQSDQLVALAAAREQPEKFGSYEQQAQQSDQLVALAAAREQPEMFGSYEQQAHQSDQLVTLAAAREQAQQSDQFVRLNAGFDTVGQVTGSGFNQMALGGLTILPSLALGSYDNPYQNQQQPQDHAHHHHQNQPPDHSHHHHQIQPRVHFDHHHQIQSQLLLEQQHLAQQQQQNQPLGQPQVAPQQQQQHRAGSEEGRNIGPSC